MLPSGETYEDFNASENCKVLLVGWSQTQTIKFDLRYGYATDVGIRVQVVGGAGFGVWIGLEYTL